MMNRRKAAPDESEMGEPQFNGEYTHEEDIEDTSQPANADTEAKENAADNT